LTDIVELQATVTAELPVGFIRSKAESELRAYLDGTLGVAYGIAEGTALVAMSLHRRPRSERRTTVPSTALAKSHGEEKRTSGNKCTPVSHGTPVALRCDHPTYGSSQHVGTLSVC